MNYKRVVIAVLTGSLLGVFCIIGAQIRYEGDLSNTYLFAFWFNRLLMGVVIGLVSFKITTINSLIRGAIIGLIISFSFYVATDFLDLTGFMAGIVYGIIIDFLATKYSK